MSDAIPNSADSALPFDDERYNPMSHEEAAEMNAVEMYVLKDLTPDEERRFEEHYFTCQECACGVAVEQALVTTPALQRCASHGGAVGHFPFWHPSQQPCLGLSHSKAPNCQSLSILYRTRSFWPSHS